MSVAPLGAIVIMLMRVGYGVGMGAAVVRVGERVLVGVRMASDEGIRYRQRGAGAHDRQRGQIRPGQPLPQEHKGEKHADERRDRVIRARFRRAEHALGADIQKNAQAVSDKAQKQRQRDIAGPRHGLPPHECDGQGTEPGKNALQDHDLIGALGRYLSCTVVFKSPADRRQQHEQRAVGKAKTVRPLEGEQKRGQGDERDGGPQPPGHGLPEYRQRDDRCGDDLKIAEQRGVGRGAPADPQHQEDRSGNVQRDHPDHKGQVSSVQPRALFPFTEQGQRADPYPRAEIEQSRHGRGPHMAQEPF